MARGIMDDETYDKTYNNRVISPFARAGGVDLGPGRFGDDPRQGGAVPGGKEPLVRRTSGGGGGIISPFARAGSTDLGPGRFGGEMNAERVTPNAERRIMDGPRSLVREGLDADAGPVRAGLAMSNPAGTRPIVTGTVMRRGEPGSGSYGERSDLSPVEVRRDNPMSILQAERKGLIVRGGASEGPMFTERDNRLVQSLRAGRDRAMEMTSAAAKGLRAKMDAGEAAGRPKSATGGNPSASRLRKMSEAGYGFDRETRTWVDRLGKETDVRREVGLAGVDADLAGTIARSEAARAELDRRGKEFEATDANAKRGLDIQERNAGPKGLDRADDAEIASGLAKYGKPKPMNPAELSRSDPNRWSQWNMEKDPAKKAALLEEPWRDDDRLAYENYMGEYRRRGMGGGAGGGQKATGGVKPVFKEGQTGVRNGKNYIWKGGKWVAQ